MNTLRMGTQTPEWTGFQGRGVGNSRLSSAPQVSDPGVSVLGRAL